MINKESYKSYLKSRLGRDIVPIKAHLTKTIILTNQDTLVGVLELEGLSYEDKSLYQLESYKTLMNNTLSNIHDPRLGIWSCLLRRKTDVDVNQNLDCEFSCTLAAKYYEKINQFVFENKNYIALVYNPLSYGSALQKKRDKSLYIDEIEAGIEKLEDKLSLLKEALSSYSPRLLKMTDEKNSEIASFYSDLLYFQPHKIPVNASNLADSVFNKRILFGNETIEIRNTSKSTFASVLSIKDYPPETSPDMLVQLLSLPFEFNFAQSFLCVDKQKAQSMMEKQRSVLINAGDVAVSQISAVDDALDDLVSGRFCMGYHNATLIVHTEKQSELRDAINIGTTALQEPSIIVVREDLANEAQYLAQLPGNYKYRPRPAVITSLNFASFSPAYGTPKGKKKGNHWGDAILPFITMTNEAYYHNNHIEDTGTLGIYGMTGAGKTVLMNTIESFLRRDGIRHVNFDKDEGSKVLIHALQGSYYNLKIGEPTGINPFALPKTKKNIYYIVDLIKLLVGEIDSNQLEMIVAAVNSVYELSNEKNRRFSSLITFLDTTVENGVAARLTEWIGDNRNGWVFDNVTDNIELADVVGFDFTEFLDHPKIRTPLMSYLLHRIMELIDGRPICIWMDEFWRLLNDDYFRDSFLQNQFKTIRKNNGCLIFATQSPSDALQSTLGKTIIEQTPTAIFLPNERATEKEYKEGFNFSDAEWEIFSPITKSSRTFMVKQGDTSLMASLPLDGMNDELNILSGRKSNNKIFESLRNSDGTLMQDWILQYQNNITEEENA